MSPEPGVRLTGRHTCKKPRKGASPVPGPTITSGVSGRAGSRNVDLRTYTGTLAPATRVHQGSGSRQTMVHETELRT